MKNLIYILFLTVLNTAFSQTNPPAGITFQAVAMDENGMELSGVDASGIPIPDKAIKVQFSVLSGSATGNVEYAEEHLTNTDRLGLFTLVIGNGIPSIGKSLKSVNWHTGDKFLRVELDISNGKGYKLVSVQQMLSVPYALYSGESLEAKQVDTLRMRDSVLHSDNIQKVQFNLDKHIIADQDTISTNELQTLSINKGTILLSQGGGNIKLPDSSDLNEIQTLSISGNKISISGAGGNTITLPGSGSGSGSSDRIIRGTTTGGYGPTTVNGSGFTVSRMYDGTYSVSFSTSFTVTPSATVSVYHTGGSPMFYYQALISSISTTGMVVKTGYSSGGGDYFMNNIGFSFVVVGQ
jgi:hypothetical protein